MISLCTVLINSATPFLDIYKDCVIAKTKLVREVCFCKVDEPPNFYKEETINGIKFKTFGYDLFAHDSSAAMSPGNQHAIGMHECIDKASQPYIFLCDPDIFFYTSVDEFYYNTMQNLQLDIIGSSHHAATEIAQGYFPWHGNLLTAKKNLPTSEWMKGKFDIEGKYLQMGKVPGYTTMFPNSNKNFDTGSYLWLWAHEQNWKWLAFQTLDCHTYTSRYYKNNSNIKFKFPKQELFYHGVSGSIKNNEVMPIFANEYKKSKEDH